MTPDHFCMRLAASTLVAGSVFATPARAQDTAQDLAKKLSNPMAALISVPMQLNFDQKIGPAEDGQRWILNLQPVVPFELNTDWNLISRTILPIVSQQDIFPGAGSQSGLGDTVQSVFFSPKAPTASGWILGAGAAFLLPTATDALLGGKKWGIGPTAVLLKQDSGWTYGALANHISSFAGDSDRAAISSTFVQPFLTYSTPTAMTFGLNTESTYDWKNSQWSVPINASVSQMLKLGDQLLSVGGGVRYWADGPATGPHGWGFRFTVTLLLSR